MLIRLKTLTNSNFVDSGKMSEEKPKKKKWIKAAIKHPGRETERAEKNGVSVHEQMEHDAHSKDKSLRGAGNLGLRLSGMHKKKKAMSAEDTIKKRYGK